MKAKLKGTNEIVEVKPKGTVKTINVTCSEFESEDGRVFPSLGLDIINDVDWEQIRIQAAIAMMQTTFADVRHGGGTIEDAAEVATRYADALIDELKNTESYDTENPKNISLYFRIYICRSVYIESYIL